MFTIFVTKEFLAHEIPPLLTPVYRKGTHRLNTFFQSVQSMGTSVFVSLLIFILGFSVLLYVIKDTFIPFPQAPYLDDAVGAFLTILIALVIPLASRRFRQSLKKSPLLAVSARIYLPSKRGKKEAIDHA